MDQENKTPDGTGAVTEPEAASVKSLPPQPPHHADYAMDTRPPKSGNTILIAGIVIGLFLILLAVAFIAPKAKRYASQQQRIEDLQGEIASLNQQKMQQAAVDQQLQQLNTQTQSLQGVIQSLQSGNMQARMTQLEWHVTQFLQQTKALGLSGMVAKVQSMQQSKQGSAVISNLVQSLSSAPNAQSIGPTFAALRQSDPNVAGLVEGVSNEDLKAAAMLLAMSQLRASLLRDNASFNSDLALLKKTLASDDPQLAAAIDRMAPISEVGVLTPLGLANQFRGLGADIVTASMAGQDVSVKDKAKARLSGLFTVEKNGQQVSGTRSQIVVAQAQKELDAGNINEAVRILKTIQGPAATQTQPFIQQAQATMMANQLQQVLGQNLVQKLKMSISNFSAGQNLPNGIVRPGSGSGMGAQATPLQYQTQ